MPDHTTSEQVIFSIKLDAAAYRAEQKLIRDSLGQLVLDIEKTKSAQQALQKARDQGKVSDAEYSAQSVKLREELKRQQTDSRELSKALETSERVMQAGAGSIDQLRARLSELTVAYNALSAAERDNSEEGQRLQAEARAVSDELKKQEGEKKPTETRATYTAAEITRAHRRCAELAELYPTWPQARVRRVVAGELGVSTTGLRYLLRR